MGRLRGAAGRFSPSVAAGEGWVGGLVTFPVVDPVQTFYGLFFVLPLATLHYLNSVAGAAWDRFRPATSLDDAAAPATPRRRG